VTLECLLEQEVREMVGARRYERLGSRKDHLNGTYLRRLLTSMGLVEIAVPHTRHSGAPADVVGRYKRRTDEVDRQPADSLQFHRWSEPVRRARPGGRGFRRSPKSVSPLAELI
jgi:transposase-like protein